MRAGPKAGIKSGTGIRNTMTQPGEPGNTLDTPGYNDGNEQSASPATEILRTTFTRRRLKPRVEKILTRIQPAR